MVVTARWGTLIDTLLHARRAIKIGRLLRCQRSVALKITALIVARATSASRRWRSCSATPTRPRSLWRSSAGPEKRPASCANLSCLEEPAVSADLHLAFGAGGSSRPVSRGQGLTCREGPSTLNRGRRRPVHGSRRIVKLLIGGSPMSLAKGVSPPGRSPLAS